MPEGDAMPCIQALLEADSLLRSSFTPPSLARIRIISNEGKYFEDIDPNTGIPCTKGERRVGGLADSKCGYGVPLTYTKQTGDGHAPMAERLKPSLSAGQSSSPKKELV